RRRFFTDCCSPRPSPRAAAWFWRIARRRRFARCCSWRAPAPSPAAGGGPAAFLKNWAGRWVFLPPFFFCFSRVVRLNLLGYFLVLAIPSLLLGAQELLSQPNGFYHRQGYIVLAALAALLAWPLAGWLTGPGHRQPDPVATAAPVEGTGNN